MKTFIKIVENNDRLQTSKHDWLEGEPNLIAKVLNLSVEVVEGAQRTFMGLIDQRGSIECWRAMKILPRYIPEFEYGARIGTCFSFKKHLAIAYEGPKGGRLYRIHASIPVESVDWPETFSLYGSGECEIRALDNKFACFLGIDWITEDGKIIDANVLPDLIGKLVETGPSV